MAARESLPRSRLRLGSPRAMPTEAGGRPKRGAGWIPGAGKPADQDWAPQTLSPARAGPRARQPRVRLQGLCRRRQPRRQARDHDPDVTGCAGVAPATTAPSRAAGMGSPLRLAAVVEAARVAWLRPWGDCKKGPATRGKGSQHSHRNVTCAATATTPRVGAAAVRSKVASRERHFAGRTETRRSSDYRYITSI
jgi:hypothetical protein